ncbi:MAG: hypothetical protein KAU21_08165 [Gammaproteobacteria bacterium]|nr:hypothetical protein [Gammaproteobacteria bacterium]
MTFNDADEAVNLLSLFRISGNRYYLKPPLWKLANHFYLIPQIRLIKQKMIHVYGVDDGA